MHIIHIFWTGKGFLVLVFGFGFSLLANLITNSVTGGPTYWDNHKWPLGGISPRLRRGLLVRWVELEK